MSKLMRASLMRLFKNKTFWISIIISVLFGVFCCLLGYQDMITYGSVYMTEDFLFRIFLLIGFFSAAFTSLFLGTEYSDGTIRNKLAAGHERTAIYLTNSLIVFIESLLVEAAYLLVVCVLGLPLFGFFTIGGAALALYLALGIVMTAAITSLLCALSMLNQNKSIVSIISLLAFVSVFVYVTYLFSSLNAPEFYEMSTIDMSSTKIVTELIENPNYITGFQRSLYLFLIDFLPVGQGLQLSCLEVSQPLRILLCSAAITLAANLAGVFWFRRKDIR